MRALSGRSTTVALASLLTLACSSAPERPPIRLSVGVHDVALRVADGWSHFDHGREHRFQQGIAQISLADVGPVTPGAYAREIEQARSLFRGSQPEDARAHLSRLQLRAAFPSHEQWLRFSGSWELIRNVDPRREVGPEEIEHAYGSALAQVGSLTAPALPALVERALGDLGHGVQRDVAEQRALTIDGQPGLRVETWDRLSHDHRESYLFVLNEGNLLVARSELGSYDETQPAFETLVDSLEILAEPTDGR